MFTVQIWSLQIFRLFYIQERTSHMLINVYDYSLNENGEYAGWILHNVEKQ